MLHIHGERALLCVGNQIDFEVQEIADRSSVKGREGTTV
jgi:hypothetical protein